ncbi:MAG: hypothetical protein JNM27_05960 [Leptospirales bacterium]|nr:hypothetical protein [Leptospirales bacterium]
MRIISALFFSILAAAFLNCQKSTQDSDTIRAAFLLGGSSRLSGKTARAGTTGAVAAVSATAGGLSTGASAYLLPNNRPQFMLALLRGMRHSRGAGRLLAALRMNRRSPIRPATFTCAGAPSNDCAQGGDGNSYTMAGTETCEDGSGIVTANNVDVTLDDDGTIFTYDIDAGSFTYSGGCGTYSIDFENYPEYKINYLSGSVTTTGTLASTVSETSNGSSSTISGFTIAHMQMVTTSADNFTVNGGTPLIMDLRIDSTDSENIIFDPTEDEIILGTASTALTMNGTINGQAVNSNISVTLTLP